MMKDLKLGKNVGLMENQKITMDLLIQIQMGIASLAIVFVIQMVLFADTLLAALGVKNVDWSYR